MDQKPKKGDAARMGLVTRIAFVTFLVALTGCMAKNGATHANHVKNETFRFDCCDPGIHAGTKEMCDLGRDAKNHTLVDGDGNKYNFIWSDCKPGEEPWRKWE